MGRHAHRPDPAQRRQVEAMAACGIPEIDIARVIGVAATLPSAASRKRRRASAHCRMCPPN
jgi:hypothetical protein